MAKNFILRICDCLFVLDQLPPPPQPEVEEKSTQRLGFFAWLLSREELPYDAPAQSVTSRPGFFAWLINREALPMDEPDRTIARSGFWSWLLMPESFESESFVTKQTSDNAPCSSLENFTNKSPGKPQNGPGKSKK